MRSRTAVRLAMAAGAWLATGCAYHNTIYNAQRIYEQAEVLRRAGQDSAARELYVQVVSRTSDAYRARPESDWAAEALYLLGRSRLRLGEISPAREALLQAEAQASAELAGSIRVYRAVALSEVGDGPGAVTLVNDALSGPLRDDARAEAHLVRAHWLLGAGAVDQGLWDLDRAAEVERGSRVEAGLERLRWSVTNDDLPRARSAASLLLSYPEGGERLDAIVVQVRSAADQWGPEAGARLLEPVSASTWERESRGRAAVERARLLRAVGDTAAASAEAWRVARTLGQAAAEARLVLAQWHLEETQDIADAYAVRGILLPAGGDPTVARLIDAVDELERFTDLGLEEPLGWFAAAEVARDRLRAEYLARGLFLAYVAGAPDEPWAPKALLAAAEVSPTPGDRAWLRGRLEAYVSSPYVLAARGRPAAGFEALEEELMARLGELRAR